jgi:hypothetical protein
MRIDNHLRLLSALIILAASAAAEEAAGFTGTWKGEQAGKTYLLMSVEPGSPFKIAFTTAHIHVGDSGEIEEIDGPVENDEKVLESKIESGGVLWFKTDNNGETMEYRMTLADEGKTALLRIVNAPDFVKPFRLKRA